VITKSRCPHTGVVNFFTEADPLLSVGSVSAMATAAHYAWHCYLDTPASGVAADMKIAEAHLRNAIAARRQAARIERCERDFSGLSDAHVF
jgi:hypothetical protein